MISNSNASAAMILHAFLLDEGFGTDPSVDLETAWPIFYSFLPDDGVRDDAICIYDTTPIGDGRLMATGLTVNHPGVQFRIRGKTYSAAVVKMNSLTNLLYVTATRASVTVDAEIFRVESISQRSGPIPLGPETDKHRRHTFTLNCIGTITKL